MIDFVKSLWQVNGTQIGSITSTYNAINIAANDPNGMTTASAFLETKLVFRCDKQRLKSLKYAMFKDLGYNRADGYTSETIASERFITALIGLGNRNNISLTVSKTNWYMGAY